MAKQHHKRPRRTTSAGSHQVNWLWGQQSVLETIHANRWRVYELFVTADVLHQHKNLLKAKQKEGVELATVCAEKLAELANTTEHEGIIARVSKYPYQSMDILESVRTTEPMALATSSAQPTGGKSIQPLIAVIDRIQDAFTFASILRCCQAAQVSAVIVGQFCQAQVTTQVARASLGAVNHFPIIQADDLASATQQLKDLGFQLIAIDPQSQSNVCDKPLEVPLAVVLASDTLGLDPKLIELCDHRVRIPSLGKTNPLPSAVAAGILLYETRRQQR